MSTSTLSDIKDLVKTSQITKTPLPLVVEPVNKAITLPEFLTLLKEHNEYFKENILKHGGILFRNFPINNERDFSEVIKHLDTGKMRDYIGGGSPRNKIIDGVYTSTEAPPSFKIPLHNELSFVKNYPSHIYFYCDIAPLEGGETPIADARKVYNAINPEVRKRFAEKKVKYVSCYCFKGKFTDFLNKYFTCFKSWTNVFETTDKKTVEKLCKENEFSYKWNQNDWLEMSQICPGVMTHPKTGETVWFNQAHIYDFNRRLLGWIRYFGTKLIYFRKHTRLYQVFYGDGSKISLKDLSHVMDVLDENTLSFKWQKGDVMVLDNVLSMHARAPFKGKRRILAAMT